MTETDRAWRRYAGTYREWDRARYAALYAASSAAGTAAAWEAVCALAAIRDQALYDYYLASDREATTEAQAA